MKVGDSFHRDGSIWLALKVTPDENAYCSWYVVVGKWTGFGPMPLWHKEEQVFIIGRKPKY